jgi:hypothetical protein
MRSNQKMVITFWLIVIRQIDICSNVVTLKDIKFMHGSLKIKKNSVYNIYLQVKQQYQFGIVFPVT